MSIFNYIIASSHDYQEEVQTYSTKDEALAQIAQDFEIDTDEFEVGSAEFWEETTHAYELGSWKAYMAFELNIQTGEITYLKPELNES